MRHAIEIELNDEMQQQLLRLTRKPSAPVRLVERAKIVLLAAEGMENIEVAKRLKISRQKAGRWRERFAQLGLAGIEKDAPRSGRIPSISKRRQTSIVKKTIAETPANATHWSRASMATATGLSESTIGRIWRAHGIKPHLNKTFKLSNDKQFAEKLEEVVGLYLNPPEHALVLSCDEKSQMQALDRTQPGLPLKKGRGATMTHDYKRNGTTSLFAALNVMNGSVIGTCMKRHRHQEWIKFLNLIKQSVPAEKDIHIICDNYATHKHQKVKNWLKRNKQFHCHFTPTSASWLNMVERFFRDLSERRLKRGVFKSVADLTGAVEKYIAHNNENPNPYIWTAKSTDILAKVKRARRTLNKLQSV
jgi:transposase